MAVYNGVDLSQASHDAIQHARDTIVENWDDIKRHAHDLGQAALSHIPYVLRRQPVPDVVRTRASSSVSELRKIAGDIFWPLVIGAAGLAIKHALDQHKLQTRTPDQVVAPAQRTPAPASAMPAQRLAPTAPLRQATAAPTPAPEPEQALAPAVVPTLDTQGVPQLLFTFPEASEIKYV